MRKLLCAVLLVGLLNGCSSGAALNGDTHSRKVILDTDMAYLNDDAIALFMLSQMDLNGDLELLGVTTVGGNVFLASATAAALRQLELIGRSDIPVYQGTDVPLTGFRNMEEESKIYGVPFFCGAYWDFKKEYIC